MIVYTELKQSKVALQSYLTGLLPLSPGLIYSWTRRQPRLAAARNMYLLQNVAMGLSAVAAWLALGLQHGPHPPWLFWMCESVLIGLGSVSSLGALGASVSVEKEWTKALCQGNAIHLSQMNAGDTITCCLNMCQLALPRSLALPMVASTNNPSHIHCGLAAYLLQTLFS